MKRYKKKKAGFLPYFTVGKVIRLVIFAILTATGFILSNRVPAMGSFGWGYTFGMIGMAILIG
ncbi:MAG TPA: hypothetical protein EYP78_00540 [Candidatus Omnitrophica bacterium]|nr:hypothetical protein [Candidatus Omnitrophota bacterium]